jgi:hypothetical protein
LQAGNEGRYNACFENPSSVPQGISFSELGDITSFSQGLEGMATGPEEKDPVYDALKALNSELHQIHTEQEFLMLNEIHHRKST